MAQGNDSGSNEAHHDRREWVQRWVDRAEEVTKEGIGMPPAGASEALPHGVYGRYLDVDLSSGATGDYEIPPKWYADHLGGKGVAARVLINELKGDEEPLAPENILIFATGPFQGTGLLGAGRHVVMGISPKTGAVADSYAGGYFGHELGRSGFDGIILRGAATEPVVLAVIDGNPELLPANELWAQGTGETEVLLKQRYPNSRVASIGIAGEKLVQSACIIHDRSRAAGRPGLGAVMGAKHVKAIVVRGGSKKRVQNEARFREERAEYAKLFLDGSMDDLGKYGTSRFITLLHEMGILPTRNFQEGVFEQAEEIDGRTLAATILADRESCAGCPVRCKRVVRTSFMGHDVLPEFGGPEYETVTAFGSLCLNHDLDGIALANQLCNDYGIDTISAGIACAFLMEASEKGLIDEHMPWGDAEAIVNLVEKIAHREGIGDVIADGLGTLAERIGGVELAMLIKGVEIPMQEPRGKQGLALSYATSPRGATHMEGMDDTMLAIDAPASELGVTRAYDRFTLSDKPHVAKLFEDLRSFENSLILCIFTSRGLGNQYKYPQIRSLLEAATGIQLSAEDMLAIGERNYALLRLHAARAGYRQRDNRLPDRFHRPLPQGASANRPVDSESFRSALRAYDKERGYDDYGPTDETLAKLGLEECIGLIDRSHGEQYGAKQPA
jgi:aldehyde:ferredoxin oxidoreductase